MKKVFIVALVVGFIGHSLMTTGVKAVNHYQQSQASIEAKAGV